MKAVSICLVVAGIYALIDSVPAHGVRRLLRAGVSEEDWSLITEVYPEGTKNCTFNATLGYPIRTKTSFDKCVPNLNPYNNFTGGGYRYSEGKHDAVCAVISISREHNCPSEETVEENFGEVHRISLSDLDRVLFKNREPWLRNIGGGSPPPAQVVGPYSFPCGVCQQDEDTVVSPGSPGYYKWVCNKSSLATGLALREGACNSDCTKCEAPYVKKAVGSCVNFRFGSIKFKRLEPCDYIRGVPYYGVNNDGATRVASSKCDQAAPQWFPMCNFCYGDRYMYQC